MHLAGIEAAADVQLLKGEAGLGLEVGDVAQVAGREIVYTDDGVALAKEAVGKVRAEKPGRAGDKYTLSQKFTLRTAISSFQVQGRERSFPAL
jgi:hypothetical protein